VKEDLNLPFKLGEQYALFHDVDFHASTVGARFVFNSCEPSFGLRKPLLGVYKKAFTHEFRFSVAYFTASINCHRYPLTVKHSF